MIKRTLGRKITVPLGARRIGVPIVLILLLICCCGPLTLAVVDRGIRQAGMLPTYTPQPTATERPTATVRPADTPVPPMTATLWPTAEPSITPLPTATSAPVRAAPAVAIPTRGLPAAESSDCDCAANTLNCSDFVAWDAQSCYLRCMELTGRDVHDLDRDHDGNACEWEY